MSGNDFFIDFFMVLSRARAADYNGVLKIENRVKYNRFFYQCMILLNDIIIGVKNETTKIVISLK